MAAGGRAPRRSCRSTTTAISTATTSRSSSASPARTRTSRRRGRAWSPSKTERDASELDRDGHHGNLVELAVEEPRLHLALALDVDHAAVPQAVLAVEQLARCGAELD